MDWDKSIRDLRAEKARLDKAIAVMEELLAGLTASGKVRSKRGRKSMSEHERAEVSLRMKKYWNDRRRKVKKQ